MPEQAEEVVTEVCHRWREAAGGVTSYIEFWEIYPRLQRRLYRRDTTTALEDVRQAWLSMTESFALNLTRVMGLSIYARILLARAAEILGHDRDALRLEALRLVPQLEDINMPYAGGRALATRAGIASLKGDHAGAAALLISTEEAFYAADMEMHAAAARRSRGLALFGHESARLQSSADEALKRCGAARPDKVGDWLMPGDWRDSAGR